MSDTVIVALISAGSSVLVAITALILNHRGFASMDARFIALENRMDRRLESIEADLKEFYRMLAEPDKRISRPEERPGG
jgi:voltage-gated potassium channel Kch